MRQIADVSFLLWFMDGREIEKILKGKKKARRTYILALVNVNMKGISLNALRTRLLL